MRKWVSWFSCKTQFVWVLKVNKISILEGSIKNRVLCDRTYWLPPASFGPWPVAEDAGVEITKQDSILKLTSSFTALYSFSLGVACSFQGKPPSGPYCQPLPVCHFKQPRPKCQSRTSGICYSWQLCMQQTRWHCSRRGCCLCLWHAWSLGPLASEP